MQTRLGPVYTRSGYELPTFACDYSHPANYIGYPELVTQARTIFHLFAPPPLLRDLDQSAESQLGGAAIGSIPVSFELGATVVEAKVFVLVNSCAPVVGTKTIFDLVRATLAAVSD